MVKFGVLLLSFLTAGKVTSQSYSNNVGNSDENIEFSYLEMEYFEVYLPSDSHETTEAEMIYSKKYNKDLNEISHKCPSTTLFASYNPVHNEAVKELTKICTLQKDRKGLLDFVEFLKSRSDVHRRVWFAGFVKAQEQLNIQNWSNKPHPSPLHLFPTTFFPNSLFEQTTSDKEYVVLDEKLGQDNGIENLLWYFREDVQMNAFHWNWHLVFPVATPNPIDRRGELFYFTHHELLARYTAERISNGLLPPVPLDLPYDSVIKEGYNPHLRDGISSSNWAARPSFSHLVSLETDIFDWLGNLTINKDRFIKSLVEGSIYRGYERTPINTNDYINVIGEAAEASKHSVNQEFYGTEGYHNEGHWVLANLGNATKDEVGAMGDVATSMRDPIFYRWHTLVDDLFIFYKMKHLPPYSLNEGRHALVVNGISVTDIRIVPDTKGGFVNLLHTYWNMHRFKLQSGLDFDATNGTNYVNKNVQAKHLDHEEFTYQITIENARSDLTVASVRIFMAPRYKGIDQRVRYTMEEQRKLFFTMDSFATELEPGINLLKRKSDDSTLTAHWPKSIEEMKETIRNLTLDRSDCECGYPHHLLLPKGTESGITFDFFVMVTDGFADEVDEPHQNSNYYHCVPNHVFCGDIGKLYPDAKPMGYPFDRRPFSAPTEVIHPSGKMMRLENKEVATLEEYVKHIPNAATTQVVIRHLNFFK